MAQLASGHKSLSMVQHYADHIKEEDIAELASARTALFTYMYMAFQKGTQTAPQGEIMPPQAGI